MHYIRFLKPPRLLPASKTSASSVLTIATKITITTDLGEAFLLTPLTIVVEIEIDGVVVPFGKGRKGQREFLWKGNEGMRSLEMEIPLNGIRGIDLSRDSGKLRVFIHPVGEDVRGESFGAVLRGSAEGRKGVVIGVRGMDLDMHKLMRGEAAGGGMGMAERRFGVAGREIRIWEETGESIARHICMFSLRCDLVCVANDILGIGDAGLILSAYLTTLSPLSPSPSSPSHPALPSLPILASTLAMQNLHILELGAGCGIVGITLSAFFSAHISQCLLTDLPEASDILEHNLHLAHLPILSHQVLDWSLPLLPPQVGAGKRWDLVCVADCTYNPDVVPDLVGTLGRLRDSEEMGKGNGKGEGNGMGRGEVKVLLAMKVRHESEMVFFELMEKEGFEILERGRIPLTVLGGEGEEIEIFVFG